MSDIVERLREEAASKERMAWGRRDGGQDATLAGMLADQAADEIERLREQLDSAVRELGKQGRELGKAEAENDRLRHWLSWAVRRIEPGLRRYIPRDLVENKERGDE